MNFKVKLAHLLDNGDKVEMEAWVEAASHDAAYNTARARFGKAVAQLASAPDIEIDKSRIEMGAEKR